MTMMRAGSMLWKVGCMVVAATMVAPAGPALLAQQKAADGAPAATPGVESVIRQMDAASARFQSAEADFRWDLYERVVKQTTTETGRIYFVRKGPATQMGAKFLPPSARLLEYKDGKMRMYTPGTNHLTELATGTNQARYESFLTLGFGGSGKDLAKSWTISDLGPEQVGAGSAAARTEKLDLVPKEQTVRNMFTHITIWVDLQRGISLKQQFFTPSGDQRTAEYSNIRYNQKVDLGDFAIKTDKKTTIERH